MLKVRASFEERILGGEFLDLKKFIIPDDEYVSKYSNRTLLVESGEGNVYSARTQDHSVIVKKLKNDTSLLNIYVEAQYLASLDSNFVAPLIGINRRFRSLVLEECSVDLAAIGIKETVVSDCNHLLWTLRENRVPEINQELNGKLTISTLHSRIFRPK